MSECKTIAICNQKGGVGKTTTALNLGAGLVKAGKRVLLVDCDPQSDLTSALGIEGERLEKSLGNLMYLVTQDCKPVVRDSIIHHEEGMDLIPSNLDLSSMESLLVNAMSREKMLANLLKDVKKDYDYILIDCMPSLGMVTINALTAADSVIIPVQAQYLPAKGMTQLLKSINMVRTHTNEHLKVGGIVMTLVDGRTNLAKEVISTIRTNYGISIRIFDSQIPVAVKAAEATKAGKSIFAYLVKETKPSEGYLLNEKWSRAFRIRTDGEMIDLTEDKVREAVERGGVQIIKRDKELKKSEALGGATLNGIVMTIKNVSGRDVVVRKDLDNKTDKVNWKELKSKAELFEAGTIKRVQSGEDVGKITVHWNKEKKAYTAETLNDDLPYGTYTIREAKTNDTYQRTDKTEHMFEVREDGTIYSYDDGNNEAPLTFDNYVYRSDVQGTKIGDGDSKRFSFVPFKIISVTNNETHVVVTDKNGFFSTKDRRAAGDLDEDEDADTARVQNPFDDLLEAESIKSADLDKRATQILQGVWFGTGEFGSTAEMNNKFGALPYDSYILEEMPCEANEGYILQKFYFTVDQKSQNGFVDLETITDDVPELGTTASVNGENVDVAPGKDITLVDVIEYKNLVRGQKYVAKGRLIDKKTGEVVKDAAGKEITAEKEFTVHFSDGKVKVEFTFDGSLLYGKDTVVFEAVYDTEGHITAKHEDLEDEGQTVTWEKLNPAYEMYKIRTTKAPSKGDKYGFFAQDEVEYEVHIENTGNIALTMDVTDTFMEGVDYFTVPELKSAVFTGRGTWNNQDKDKFVANITLNPKEKATITYTAQVKDEAKAYLAAAAKDSDSLDEKGHDTNIVYQKNETDDHDGYWNTASCTNVTYPNPENPDEPGTLEPKEDYAQTPVQKPEIGTTLTAKNGDKAVVEGEKTILVDTITYKALDTTKWYVFTGELMVKDTGDPLVENGTPITVTSKPFKPLLKNGKVKVTFEINTKGLAGKELVAFETAYRLDGYKKGDDVEKTPKTIVAEHKDLKDKGQTIKVAKPGTPIEHSPKTGDDVHILLAIALMLLAAGGIAFAVKRRRADSPDDSEDIVE